MIEDQPAPINQPGHVAVWELVIADVRSRFQDWCSTDSLVSDMAERDRLGRERYGMPLTTGNGRDHIVDAYQESLDQCVYLRAWLEEHPTRSINRAAVQGIYTDALRLAYDLRVLISDLERTGGSP